MAAYHPSAPSSDVFDMQTTVDPSYIISLIRKLLPNNIKTENDAAWEEFGCILWDLAVNKDHALLMVENLLLQVLLASLTVSKSSRITEIGLGILANIACHDVLRNSIVSLPGLIDTVVDHLFVDDSLCLCQVFWLLTLGLQGSDCVTWANALQPEHILCRIFWVSENTLNIQLLEKSIGLVLAIVDSQQVGQTLLPSLMQLGLPNLLVSILACEMKHLSCERVPDRYPVLDTVLRVIEALSVLDNYSEVISSNKELLHLIYDLLKLPDKSELSSSCVTSVVLIANILSDEPDLAPEVSQDLTLLQGLLDLFPSVSNDLEARSALWSVLGRVLVWVEEDKMSPLNLHQYIAVLVGKLDVIEEDLIDHHVEDSNEDHESLNSSLTKAIARPSLSRISSILKQWTAIRGSTAQKDSVSEDSADDENIDKLLRCCQKYIADTMVDLSSFS